MLRRNSARSEHRRPLCRSKSTGSVARNPVCDLVSIEPVDAQRDAQIAALRSFYRANSQSSNREKRLGMMLPPASQNLQHIPRSHSFTSGPDVITNSTKHSGDEDPSAKNCDGVKRRQSIRFAGPNAQPKKDPAMRAHGVPSCSSDVPERHRESLYIKSHDRPASLMNKTRDKYVDNSSDLSSHEAIYVLDRQMQAKAQGRLRKSQSMFNTSLPPPSETHVADDSMNGFSTWTSGSIIRPQYTGIGSERCGRQQLRAPKSMSFLRLHSGKSILGGVSHTGSLNLGRGRKNGLEDGRQVKRRPSIFFRSKHKRLESSGECALALQNDNHGIAPNSSAISSSTSLPKPSGLRNTARKVSKSVRSKIKGIFGRSKNSSMGSSAIGSHDVDSNSYQSSDLSVHEASVSRVQSHVPSLHSVSSNRFLHSRQGSLESVEVEFHEIEGQKSRVTSWTNSSTHTAMTYGRDGEWEPQRLSVIDEGNNLQSPQRWQSSKGNERMYSALVQRLDDLSKQQTSETPAENDPRGEVNKYGIGYAQDDDDVFRSTPHIQLGGPEPASLDEAVAKWKAETASAIDEAPGSPETTASISNHLFRAHSPYRRALRQSMEANQGKANGVMNLRYLSSLSALSLPTRRPSPDNEDGDFRVTSAESVYSHSSDDETIIVGSHDGSEQHSPDFSTHHALSDVDVRSSPARPVHQREVSSTSSVEWKTWLSANVSKLESGIGSKEFTEAQAWNPWTSIGHVREPAEIDPVAGQSRLSSRASVSSYVRDDSAEAKPALLPMQNTKTQTQTRAAPGETPQQKLSENQRPASLNRSKGIYEYSDGKDGCENKKMEPHGNVLRTVSSLPNVKRSKAVDLPRSYCAAPQVSCVREASDEQEMDESPRRSVLSNVRSDAWSSARSTPGLSIAVKRQFGTMSTGSPQRRAGFGDETGRKATETSPHVRSVSGGASDAQIMGSKRMVELFLNSRRNRIAGNGSERSVSGSSAVFI